MPVLDFTEIPTAASGRRRDQFELFAREFLKSSGFKIVVGPDRGADAGRDLIVEEVRTGVAGETRVRWLVSCKHKAHSGTAVTPDDEPDIRDRLQTHDCVGFLAIYSTVPSSGLAAKLHAPKRPFEVQIFDPETIEHQLLSSAQGVLVAERFFPQSWSKWKKERERPNRATLFKEQPELRCGYCGKNLLSHEPKGIVVGWTTLSKSDSTPEHTEHFYWCCKGQCDRALNAKYRRTTLVDGWKDISELAVPIEYLRWTMAVLNTVHDGETFSKQAFHNTKQILINLFPLVARDLTDAEKARIRMLSGVPSFLGGWDYGK